MKPRLLGQSGLQSGLLLGFVCRSCQQESNRRALRNAVSFTTKSLSTLTNPRSSDPSLSHRSANNVRTQAYTTSQSRASLPKASLAKSQYRSHATSDLLNLEAELFKLMEDCEKICSETTVPREAQILDHLRAGRKLSEALIHRATEKSQSGIRRSKQVVTPGGGSESSQDDANDAISETLYHLLCDPKVFITLEMLQIYVHVQVLLSKPEFLPEIFHLYAHKPAHLSIMPTWMLSLLSSPNLPKNAIPLPLASAALTSAIGMRSLPLALSVIESAIATPAFRRSKILRRCTVPFATIAITPVAVQLASNHIGHNLQNTIDPTIATWLSFAGMTTYLATLLSLGSTALLTFNDQMMRVTWRPGTPLRERWLREEERWAFDQIALAWGLRDKKRWGEEEGEDWEALREFCGRREMVVDRTNLLENMQ